MKKSLMVLGSCLGVSLALLTGCSDTPSAATGKSAQVSEVELTSVKLPESVSYERSATAADKEEITSSLNNAGIASKMSSAADYSSVSTGKSSSRDISVDDLDTIYDEISDAFKDYNKTLMETGAASASYEKEIGEVTGLKDGITMSIPLIKVSESSTYRTVEVSDEAETADETGTTEESAQRPAGHSYSYSIPVEITDNYSQSVSSALTEDLTALIGEDCGEIKTYAVSSAQNYSNAYSYTFDYDGYKTLMSEYAAAIKEAQESETPFDGRKFMSDYSKLTTTTTTTTIDYATNSVMAFVTETNNIAGKLKIEIKLNGTIGTNDEEAAAEDESEEEEIEAVTEETVAEENKKHGRKSQKDVVEDMYKNFSASVTMDVYDTENNFLFNYKTLNSADENTSVADVLEFINFMDTTNLDSMFSTSEEDTGTLTVE